MDFIKYRRLKMAVLSAGTFEKFILRIGTSTRWYGVSLWNKEHYRWFYDRIKGGARYDDITKAI